MTDGSILISITIKVEDVVMAIQEKVSIQAVEETGHSLAAGLGQNRSRHGNLLSSTGLQGADVNSSRKLDLVLSVVLTDKNTIAQSLFTFNQGTRSLLKNLWLVSLENW